MSSFLNCSVLFKLVLGPTINVDHDPLEDFFESKEIENERTELQKFRELYASQLKHSVWILRK